MLFRNNLGIKLQEKEFSKCSYNLLGHKLISFYFIGNKLGVRFIISELFISDGRLNETLISYQGLWFNFQFMHICDMIKGNESDVENIDFELQAKIDNRFLCFALFLNFTELSISLQPDV